MNRRKNVASQDIQQQQSVWQPEAPKRHNALHFEQNQGALKKRQGNKDKTRYGQTDRQVGQRRM